MLTGGLLWPSSSPFPSTPRCTFCDFLANLPVSFHGVCVFPAQDLTPDELSSLALALGKASGAPSDSSLHIHPTAELGENGRPTVGAISNVAGAMGRQINFQDERSALASQGIHSDIVSCHSELISLFGANIDFPSLRSPSSNARHATLPCA